MYFLLNFTRPSLLTAFSAMINYSLSPLAFKSYCYRQGYSTFNLEGPYVIMVGDLQAVRMSILRLMSS